MRNTFNKLKSVATKMKTDFIEWKPGKTARYLTFCYFIILILAIIYLTIAREPVGGSIGDIFKDNPDKVRVPRPLIYSGKQIESASLKQVPTMIGIDANKSSQSVISKKIAGLKPSKYYFNVFANKLGDTTFTLLSKDEVPGSDSGYLIGEFKSRGECLRAMDSVIRKREKLIAAKLRLVEVVTETELAHQKNMARIKSELRQILSSPCELDKTKAIVEVKKRLN